MKKIKNFLKEEKAAAQMIEAAIIYPVVFLIIFLMIYLGLYILQSVTIGVYAQKVAMLASREVSSPGYFTFTDKQSYSNSGVELTGGIPQIDQNKIYEGFIDERTSSPVVYRYWRGEKAFNDKSRQYYTDILSKMVKENSIIASGNKVKVDISCENNFVAQFIDVKVEQELMHFSLLDFFGIKSPTISATAKATVSDTDELVRNVDFVADALKVLADKLGIDLNNVSSTVRKVCTDLGLYEP